MVIEHAQKLLPTFISRSEEIFLRPELTEINIGNTPPTSITASMAISTLVNIRDTTGRNEIAGIGRNTSAIFSRVLPTNPPYPDIKPNPNPIKTDRMNPVIIRNQLCAMSIKNSVEKQYFNISEATGLIPGSIDT
jgi:hypothetical protein